MDLDEIIRNFFQGRSEEEKRDFLGFMFGKIWGQYDQQVMDRQLMIENEVNAMALPIPNANEGKPYEFVVALPPDKASMVISKVEGLTTDTLGLETILADDGRSFTITGTPSLAAFRDEKGKIGETSFNLTISYKYAGVVFPPAHPVLTKTASITINPDPRKLWVDLPVKWDEMPPPRYETPDQDKAYVPAPAPADGTQSKEIVAASKRGRSHAQEGTPRDDNFRVRHLETGWYILAVADGAGSAKFSREGSRIACDTVTELCTKSLLEDNEDLEAAISMYDKFKDQREGKARKQVGDALYHIAVTAAYQARKNIEAEASKRGKATKDYATTLLLAICKKFDYGWFIASFWVGDGAICLYGREAHTARILGTPDEGEFGGQTRFLTMPEIFSDAEALYKRLRVGIVPDFTALFLMSDGVSDPKFETNDNLNNPDRWDDLWKDLEENGVDLSHGNEASKEQLLSWLDFWSPGNHDDRTIAILH